MCKFWWTGTARIPTVMLWLSVGKKRSVSHTIGNNPHVDIGRKPEVDDTPHGPAICLKVGEKVLPIIANKSGKALRNHQMNWLFSLRLFGGYRIVAQVCVYSLSFSLSLFMCHVHFRRGRSWILTVFIALSNSWSFTFPLCLCDTCSAIHLFKFVK